MKRTYVLPILAAAALIPALSQSARNPFAGRWDLTVTVGSDKYPSWLEVTEKDGGLQARAQQRTGNVAPVAAVKMEGQRLIVTVDAAAPPRPAADNRPAFPGRPEVVWEFTEKGGKLTGTQKGSGQPWQIAGVRAPALKHATPAAWANPEPLFNGKDLTGWAPVNNTPETIDARFTSHWAVKNGDLTNEARGSNIKTTRTFNDFKLHVEFNCPPGENSGVYLRGRYEAQVGPPPDPSRQQPPPAKKSPARAPGAVGGGYRNPFGFVGCIYGMLGPAKEPQFKPDWQTYDFTLVGRMVTVAFNGITTIDNQEIAGPTGGALDSNEAEPGSIYLQGDHHGGIRYRNITISVPKR